MSKSRYVVSQNHPLYRRGYHREILLRNRELTALQRLPGPFNNPLISAHHSNLITDSPGENDWIAWFAREYGPFESGLSIGSSVDPLVSMLHAGMFRQLELLDPSPYIIEAIKWRLVGLDLNVSVSAGISDPNSLNLAKKNYDIVILYGTLHQVVNLEHLLEQVRRTLKPEGRLVIFDYIGPSRWQWEDISLKEVQRAIELFRKRHKNLNFTSRLQRPAVKAIKRNWPFRAVRSDEILSVLQQGFTPQREVYTNRLLYLLLHEAVIIDDWSRPDLKLWLREAISWEDQLHSGSEVAPCTLWGVYSPAQNPIPLVQRWSELEIRRRIGVSWWNPKGWARQVGERLLGQERMRRREKPLIRRYSP